MQPSVERAPGWQVVTQALRGPRSISLLGCLILLIPSIVATMVVDIERLDNPGIAFLTLVAVTFADVVVLVAADRTLLRHRRTSPVPLGRVVLVYLVAALIRPLTASAVSAMVGLPAVTATRYLGSVLVGVTSLILVAVVLDQADRYRDTMLRLHQEREVLEEQQLSFDTRLLEEQRAIASVVKRDVAGGLADLERDVRSTEEPVTPDRLHATAVRIRALAEGTVRPLSHTLRRQTYSPPEVGSNPGTVTRLLATDWRRILMDALVIHPYSPVVLPILFFVMSVPFVLIQVGFARGLPALAIESVVMALGLFVAEKVMPRSRRSRLPGWAQVLSFVIALVAATLVADVAAYAVWPAHDLTIHLFGYAFVLVVGYAIAVAFSTADSAQITTRSLSSALAAEQWEVNREQQRFSEVAHDASRALHGRVQSTLSILALNLDTVANDADATHTSMREALDSTADTLQELVATLPTDKPHIDQWQVGEAIREVAATWDGLIDVEIAIGPATCEAAERHGIAGALLELVRESITNAARHGGCTAISISAAVDGGYIDFVALDDGRGPSQTTTAGLGLGELSELGVQWSWQAEPTGGARLSARFPLVD